MKRLKLKPFFLVFIQVLFFVLLGFAIFCSAPPEGFPDEPIDGIGKGP